ncbi:MAG: TRAP transporter small permease [Paralcaligenes sp.]
MDHFVDAILATILVVTTVTLILGVFFRYVLNDSLPWTDEIAGNLLGWISFIGAYSCFRKKMHLDFDAVLMLLPAKVRAVVEFMSSLLMLGFAVTMAWISLIVVEKVGGSYISSVDIYRGVFISAIPAAFILISIALIAILLNIIYRRGR